MSIADTQENISSADYEYPHKTSVQLLNRFNFATLVDAGCGTDTRLAQYAKLRLAAYVGFDADAAKDQDGVFKPVAQILGRKLKELGITAQTLEADICSIEPEDFDRTDHPTVVHARFVLAQLNKPQRVEAIKRCAQLGQIVILMEYDWTAMLGRDDDFLFVESVKQAILDLMMQCRVDAFAGHTLFSVAGEAIKPPYTMQSEKLARPMGPWTGELLALVERMLAKAQQIKRFDLVAKFGPMIRKLRGSITLGEPICFRPAEIVIAIITR